MKLRILNGPRAARARVFAAIRVCAAVAVAVLLSGCLDNNTVVKLNRDGSGTIEESLLVSSSFLETMRQMNFAMGGGIAGDEEAGDEAPAARTPMGRTARRPSRRRERRVVDAESGATEEAGEEEAYEEGGEEAEEEYAGESPAESEEADPLAAMTAVPSQEQLEEMARRMGPGVSPVSAEPLESGSAKGYKVVFRFTDINQVRLNQNPASGLSGSPMAAAAADPEAEESYTFRFTRGNPGVLQIIAPPEPPQEAEEEADPQSMGQEEREAMLEMMRLLYKDLRVRISVELPGSIVSSNASYRQGNRVTLVDLDLTRLLEDEARFRQLAMANPKTLQESKALLQNTPGIRVELKERVEVRFR